MSNYREEYELVLKTSGGELAKALEQQIKRAEDALEALQKELKAGSLPFDVFDEKTERVTKRLEELRSRLERARESMQPVGMTAEQAAFGTLRLDTAMSKVGQTAGRGGALGSGLLQGSYILQDFTSAGGDLNRGLFSIQNNIPGFVMAMGMSGGVAGTVSLASMAFGAAIANIETVKGLFDDGATAREAERWKSLGTNAEDAAKAAERFFQIKSEGEKGNVEIFERTIGELSGGSPQARGEQARAAIREGIEGHAIAMGTQPKLRRGSEDYEAYFDKLVDQRLAELTTGNQAVLKRTIDEIKKYTDGTSEFARKLTENLGLEESKAEFERAEQHIKDLDAETAEMVARADREHADLTEERAEGKRTDNMIKASHDRAFDAAFNKAAAEGQRQAREEAKGGGGGPAVGGVGLGGGAAGGLGGVVAPAIGGVGGGGVAGGGLDENAAMFARAIVASRARRSRAKRPTKMQLEGAMEKARKEVIAELEQADREADAERGIGGFEPTDVEKQIPQEEIDRRAREKVIAKYPTAGPEGEAKADAKLRADLIGRRRVQLHQQGVGYDEAKEQATKYVDQIMGQVDQAGRGPLGKPRVTPLQQPGPGMPGQAATPNVGQAMQGYFQQQARVIAEQAAMIQEIMGAINAMTHQMGIMGQGQKAMFRRQMTNTYPAIPYSF